MLDEQVLALLRKTTSPQLQDRDRQLEMEVRAAQVKLRGQGRLYLHIMLLYEREVAARAHVIWSNLHRAHGSLGSKVTPELRADFGVALREDINAMMEALRTRFDVDMKDAPQDSKQPTWAARLDAARDHELARYEAEIEHYVANLEAAAARGTPAATSYTIHGNVGAVLTGQGAVANVVQNINPGEREVLLKALEVVRQAIGAAPEFEERSRRELTEFADEATEELKKENPNTLRLSLTLQTLAAAVQGIASAPGAYEVLRTAAAAIGISL